MQEKDAKKMLKERCHTKMVQENAKEKKARERKMLQKNALIKRNCLEKKMPEKEEVVGKGVCLRHRRGPLDGLAGFELCQPSNQPTSQCHTISIIISGLSFGYPGDNLGITWGYLGDILGPPWWIGGLWTLPTIQPTSATQFQHVSLTHSSQLWQVEQLKFYLNVQQ